MAHNLALIGLSPLKSIHLTDISAHQFRTRLLLSGIWILTLRLIYLVGPPVIFLGGFLAKLAPVQCSYLGFLHLPESRKLIIG